MNNKVSKGHAKNEKRPCVLIAVSDEDFALTIADFVEGHNWPENTHFHVLYVVEEQSIRRVLRFSPHIAQQVVEDDEAYGARLVRKIETHLHKAMPNAKIETSIGRGFAKNEILSTAAKLNAGFIVLGSHAGLRPTSILLGSVSLAVMMEANCSVLVVRLPASQSDSRITRFEASEDLPKQMTSLSER
jgi:nucleotide-binding universal stress UspA family protein